MQKISFQSLFKIIFLLVFFVVIFLFLRHLDLSTSKKPFDPLKENYVFLGDSITYGYKVEEFFDKYYVVNSGINGNTTSDILNDLEKRVYQYNPTKVFLLIGINDLKKNVESKTIINNIDSIITNIKRNRPYTEIYVESIYPLGKTRSSKNFEHIQNNTIKEINNELELLCKKKAITYINVYDTLLEGEFINPYYTKDGVHLTDLGYYKVTKVLEGYMGK